MKSKEEIIKALRTCGSRTVNCTGCPYYEKLFGTYGDDICAKVLKRDAADLIELSAWEDDAKYYEALRSGGAPAGKGGQMDKGERNCIAVCGAGMLEYLMLSGHDAFDDFANCVLVAGWIPPEDRHVFLIDAEKWDALMETAEVWEKNDG